QELEKVVGQLSRLIADLTGPAAVMGNGEARNTPLIGSKEKEEAVPAPAAAPEAPPPAAPSPDDPVPAEIRPEEGALAAEAAAVPAERQKEEVVAKPKAGRGTRKAAGPKEKAAAKQAATFDRIDESLDGGGTNTTCDTPGP